jgi:hypothetical protein
VSESTLKYIRNSREYFSTAALLKPLTRMINCCP